MSDAKDICMPCISEHCCTSIFYTCVCIGGSGQWIFIIQVIYTRHQSKVLAVPGSGWLFPSRCSESKNKELSRSEIELDYEKRGYKQWRSSNLATNGGITS